MKKHLPESLLESIHELASLDLAQFEESQFSEPSVSIRSNPAKPATLNFDLHPVPWCEHGFYLNERPSFTADPLFHAGVYYVQEASSMFLSFALKQTLSLENPIKVLDLCAAPGGKSTLIASLLNEESLLVSNEVIQTRANILCENMTKWGQINTWVTNSDPKQFGKLDSFFDALIIDAPCSGSGLFRRIPDYLHDWSIDNVNLCSQRQKRILHDSFACLSAEGILVYMTCSFSRQENEDVVDYIMKEFDVENIDLTLPPEWNIVRTLSSETKSVGYRFYPHLLQGEGFFMSIFRKRTGHSSHIPSARAEDHRKLSFLKPFISLEKKCILTQKDNLIAIHENHRDLYTALSAHIKLIKKGIMLGKVIRNELIPDHELAMYAECTFEDRIELSLENAISYLKKDELAISSDTKGWKLVTYNKIPLGWIKQLGNRNNNYFPSNYRILSKNILPF